MADTIAGIPKKYAIGAALAAAGVLGYAWWKNGQSGSVDPAEVPLEAAVDEYESPLGNTGTNSTGSFPGNVDPEKIDTNGEWTQAAVDYLQSVGYEGGAVASALGKYLAFKELSATEAQIVMAARAGVGDPPVGGPYPIKDALPTPPTQQVSYVAPTGLRAKTVNRTGISIDWDPMPGVKGYIVYQDGGRNRTVVYSESAQQGLKPNTSYRFSVQNVYPGDKLGPMSGTITVRTKK